jgi:large subunit ribosomal protein L15
MQLHQLSPTKKAKKAKRIGRGGKKGNYSGRGMKGQKSRAGRKLEPIVRESIKRYPKKRGYRQNRIIGKQETAILNLSVLDEKFEKGGKINPKILLEKKIINRVKGKLPRVKILGKGETKKKFSIENCFVSKSVTDKIKKAGGEIC